jgi:hypothetical protein
MSNPQKNYSSKYSSESKRRKTVGLTIKPELLAKAREMNLNLSKTLEKSLETIIDPKIAIFLMNVLFQRKFSGAAAGI